MKLSIEFGLTSNAIGSPSRRRELIQELQISMEPIKYLVRWNSMEPHS